MSADELSLIRDRIKKLDLQASFGDRDTVDTATELIFIASQEELLSMPDDEFTELVETLIDGYYYNQEF